jgi:ketosteroid isomerase-like protein
MTPEEVLVLYGRAWFERDREQRIEVLRNACTEDIVFMDPQLGRLHGLAAVADMIGNYMNPPMEGNDAEAGEEHARGDVGLRRLG